ncbi:MAG: hypothetical protein AMS17_00270 [Spirochaetes bacterium DG_61]|nr:MAG: hypothetical protein AMS17_00270 [Spirochaetes bacterium DG_61]
MNLLSVVLGSDSDIAIYRDVADLLDQFHLSYERRILSAHRTPDELKAYVQDAEGRGIKVFIAIAGMAAALPGVIASFTILPVIGVPVAQKSPLMGFDSLFSMVQMPPGVPVASVAINGGKNAALLAVQIIALSDAKVSEKLKSYREELRASVHLKDQRLQEQK